MADNSSNHLQKLFEKAARSLQSGNIQDARKGFMKLSKQASGSAVVWYNLGLCHQHENEHRKAVEAYRQCVKINPDMADAWINLGISLKETGKSDEAREAADRALKKAPGHPRALNLLGSIQAETQDLESARASFNQSISSDPGNIDARVNLANLEFNQGNLDTAESLTNDLYLRFPGEAKVKLLKARVLVARKKNNDALPLVTELENTDPDNEEVLRLSLSFREAIRDYFGAVNYAEKLLQHHPEDANALNSLGSAYFQLDGIEKAKYFYEKATAIEPNNAEFENNLGLAHSSLGDKVEAEKHYRRSLELDPKHAETWRNIAAMKKFSSLDDPDAKNILDYWGHFDELDNLSRIKLSFALGKIYDDCGLSEKAFETYKIGNDLKFSESSIDLEKYFSHIDTIPKVLNTRPATVNTSNQLHTPIFVLGMPRSGTTLIEQILSRHSLVSGYGELPCIERAITRFEKKSVPMRAYPGDFLNLAEDELKKESEEYMRWVSRLHTLETPCFTDKMPFNFAHVWLIKSLFPDSPIVHCRRHPLDVITSNYFQLYGSDISFVYDLPTLAMYYIRYDHLMKHWNTLFQGEIYNVIYEQFVADNESETRKLIAGARLEWEDNCLDSSRSDTAVRTASIWQVRQGIYTSSRERWRKYENQLAPVIEILSEADILDTEGNWRMS